LVEPAYTLESPKPVPRKIFISWIVESRVTTTSWRTPMAFIWMLHKEGESGDKQTKNYKSLGEVFKTYNKGKLRPSLIPSSLFDCNGPTQLK
jgi:hypothetical protein